MRMIVSQSVCAGSGAERGEEERTCDRLIAAARRRDHATAARLLDKLRHADPDRDHDHDRDHDRDHDHYWKLDSWEDDARRRRRLVPNPRGSSHPEATLHRPSDAERPHDAILQVTVIILFRYYLVEWCQASSSSLLGNRWRCLQFSYYLMSVIIYLSIL